MGENAGVSDYYGVGARSVEASLRRAARPSLTMTTMIRQLSPAQFSGPRPRCHHWWRLLSACCSCISVSLSESDHLTGSGHGQSRPPSIAATVWAWGGGQECVGLFPLPPSTTHTRTHTHTLHHRSRERERKRESERKRAAVLTPLPKVREVCNPTVGAPTEDCKLDTHGLSVTPNPPS